RCISFGSDTVLYVMDNACEHPIGDTENAHAGKGLVRSQVVPQAPGVAERTRVDRVICSAKVVRGSGSSLPLALGAPDIVGTALGRQSRNRGSSGKGHCLSDSLKRRIGFVRLGFRTLGFSHRRRDRKLWNGCSSTRRGIARTFDRVRFFTA